MDGSRELAMSETFSGLDGDGAWVGGPGLFASLWRYRLVIVAVTALAAIAGYAVSLLLPVRYEAQANLYVRDPGSPAVLNLGGSSQSASGDHAVFMATQAQAVGSDAVYSRALQLLRRDGTPADVKPSVVVEPSADLASIAIRVTSGNPADAVNLANAIGTAYQQVASERIAADSKSAIAGLDQLVVQREAEFDSLQAQIAQSSGPEQVALQRKALHVGDLIGDLQVHQSEIASQAALYGSGVESFHEAVPPAPRSQPTASLLGLVGAAIGFVAASGWAWWAAGRNRRVEVEGDAGAVLGVPLLAELPRLEGKLQAGVDPVAAEAYHFLLVGLEHALSKVGGKSVAVVSTGPGDGKTVTVLNLALAARREGRKVMLVDGDERTRRLAQLCRDGEQFDVTGMTADGEQRDAVTVMTWPPTPRPRSGEATKGSVLQIEPTEQNGHHPAVFFRSTSFDKLISSGESAADLVLIDTPPLLQVSEAVTIADKADAVVLVVNRGTSVADLRRAQERLSFTDTPLIGYLLNRGSAPRAYPGAGGGKGDARRSGSLRGLLRRR